MPPRSAPARRTRRAIGSPSSYDPLFRILLGPLVASRCLHGPVVPPIPPKSDRFPPDLQGFHRARLEVLLHHDELASSVELDDVPGDRTEIYDFSDAAGCRA